MQNYILRVKTKTDKLDSKLNPEKYISYDHIYLSLTCSALPFDKTKTHHIHYYYLGITNNVNNTTNINKAFLH